jgi:hypothetical protein
MNNSKNRTLFGKAGGCEGMLEVTELHYRNPEFAYASVKAMFHLCDGNDANRLKISFSGAADILMSILNRYSDDDRIVEYVYSIMVGMCLDKVGQSRLGTVGVCKTVVSSLYKFEKSSEYALLLCCSLIANLACNSTVNQNKLGSAGACKAIVTAMSRFVSQMENSSINKKTSKGSVTANNLNSSTMNNKISSATTQKSFPRTTSRLSPKSDRGSAHPNSNTTIEELDNEDYDGPLVDFESDIIGNNDILKPIDLSSPDSIVKKNITYDIKNNSILSSDIKDEDKTTLAHLVEDLCVMKECCKAIVFLSTNNEQNRLKFLSTGVILDLLTYVLSASFSSAIGANVDLSSNSIGLMRKNSSIFDTNAVVSLPNDQCVISDQTRDWATCAMDALIGKTF